MTTINRRKNGFRETQPDKIKSDQTTLNEKTNDMKCNQMKRKEMDAG
jgi:hypothetical protein